MKIDVFDQIMLDLTYAKTLLGQAQVNHMLRIAQNGMLARDSEYDYCRTFPYTSAILDIVQEKITDAIEALKKGA